MAKNALQAVDGTDMGGTVQFRQPFQRNHGASAAEDTNRNGWQLPGPLLSTRQVAGHGLTSSSTWEEVREWLGSACHPPHTRSRLPDPDVPLMSDISPEHPQHCERI